jgi:crossover junction endodeoxyribonuclease RusA
MKPITLVLPYPISANRYWRNRVAKGVSLTYVSAEAKAFKREVQIIAMQCGIKSPFPGRVQIDLKLYPKRPLDYAKRARLDPATWDDTVQCLDLDNARKVLYDAFKGVLIIDDKFVRRDSGERMEPDGEARVVVTITPLVAFSAQASLLEAM